jgi:BetI-type transcriptional repressor, C-terminal
VNVAFAGAALCHPGLAEARRASHERVRALLLMILAEARARNELDPDVVDADVVDDFIVVAEGTTLLALVDERHPGGCTGRLQRIAQRFVERLGRC